MSDSDSKASGSKTLENSPQPSDRPIDAEPQEGEKTREDPGYSENASSDSGGGERDEKGGENGDEGEGEEEGECGFCLFMKGGGCRESFIAWENCIEEAEKNKEDIVEKCFQVTGDLKKCMEAHADYYEPILRAEKAAEEEAIKELEKEAAANDSEQNVAVPEPSDSDSDNSQGISAEKHDG
ncbi:uncharacterized protein LOC133823008 [Humulus lupulus]|uniref:uncharacterized protein LOC133823008 n=1 Tax=Humulus lupulus TaxID=3486 RepID=UPI002B4004AA|nr:uncharacterized protein LOC133823008 [Humulus lupulus]